MKHITVAGLHKPVSQLMKGSDYFTHNNYDKAAANLDAFFAIGGNAIDTAHIYTGGESEAVIGRYFQERGNREQWVILTKGAHHDENGPRVNREAIRSDLAESLERLQTSYIDMYAVHRDDLSVPAGDIIEALNEHIASGAVRSIGASNWSWHRMQEANDYAAAKGLAGFSFSSPNLSLAKANEPFWPGCVSADSGALAWHRQTQLPLFAWSSQARGFFTGRFSPEDRTNADLVRVFYSDGNWERLARAKQLAERKNVTAIQIALAYVLNQPFPACALIGAQSAEELRSCDEGSRIALTQEELDWLDLTVE
ncbi:aldo/keto reductase [Paenibacillus sp. MMS18-CY102]|uniref:aldo/keto reductase n=1 Tax=Paenibacillus sp. MMS18-CY102 TaxID=2682849 RepID=UPI0013665828|nr:aldo/keto reductase [Paenibacillus sp. MMS18-CY102]MWC29662.1 aldo/keto reductase [Paenibacillus sp. MMS18-CY102]